MATEKNRLLYYLCPLFLLLASSHLSAEYFQCKATDGSIAFTDNPGDCASEEETFVYEPVKRNCSIYQPQPVSGTCEDTQEGFSRLGSFAYHGATGLAFDGKELWVFPNRSEGTTIKRIKTNGDLITSVDDPHFLSGTRKLLDEHHPRGDFVNIGGAAYANGRLWLSSGMGGNYGSLAPNSASNARRYDRIYKKITGSSSYSASAHDGCHLWMIWQGQDYASPNSSMQRLLKVNPVTGAVIRSYPADLGDPRDATHGLAWDGTHLWHGKENVLQSISPDTGRVLTSQRIPGISRISALASDGCHLYLADFNGKLGKIAISSLRR